MQSGDRTMIETIYWARCMQSPKVTDMTVAELKALVNQLVDERVRHHAQMTETIDQDKLKQLMETIERHRWTPPPGTPSVVELLREDRDR